MKRQKQKKVRSRPKSRASRRRKPKLAVPKTAREYFSLPAEFRDSYERTLHVISEMRAFGRSLRRTSQEIGINPRLVKQLARSALRKSANGRYVATRNDRLLRVLVILTVNGLDSIAVNDFRQASLIGNYWVAVQRYLLIGDPSRLEAFEGVKITDVNGQEYLLLTNLEELMRLGYAGAVSIESIYARSA